MSTALMAHGRLLADMRPRETAYGVVYDWTVEDLEADGDMLVASGTATSPEAAQPEIVGAVLATVRAAS